MRDEGKKPNVSASTLRIAVGVHVAATCVCAVFSMLDRSSVGLPPEGSLLRGAVGVLLGTSLLAWMACPIAVLTLAVRRGLSRQTTCAMLAEILLCTAQAFALLPSVE